VAVDGFSFGCGFATLGLGGLFPLDVVSAVLERGTAADLQNLLQYGK
jgi:hypothetical protein